MTKFISFNLIFICLILVGLMFLTGCAATSAKHIIAPVSRPVLGPIPEDSRLLVKKELAAEIIKASLVDLQNWKLDALTCRATY